MVLTKNFSLEEFEASETADRYHINNKVTSSAVLANLKSLCTDVLQPLRDVWGKPLHINSGYRSIALNTKVGGVNTSQHLLGEAADVAADSPIDLARMVRDLGLPFDQMILYPTFVHISHRRTAKRNRGRILYNYRYLGKKL